MSSPDGVGRPEADHRIGGQPLLGHHALEHGLRVVEQLPRFRADDVVVEDARIFALQLPGLEEGRPVDVGHELGQLVALEGARADQLGNGRRVARPVDLEAVVARGLQRQARLLGLALEVGIADLDVVRAHALAVAWAIGLRHQARHHADGPAGVRDVDGLAAHIVGRDLHRGMHAAGGGAADQQRHTGSPSRSISAATWHISSSEGVISPDRPMMSAFSRLAVSRIFCAGTITPRSITW